MSVIIEAKSISHVVVLFSFCHDASYNTTCYPIWRNRRIKCIFSLQTYFFSLQTCILQQLRAIMNLLCSPDDEIFINLLNSSNPHSHTHTVNCLIQFNKQKTRFSSNDEMVIHCKCKSLAQANAVSLTNHEWSIFISSAIHDFLQNNGRKSATLISFKLTIIGLD